MQLAVRSSPLIALVLLISSDLSIMAFDENVADRDGAQLTIADVPILRRYVTALDKGQILPAAVAQWCQRYPPLLEDAAGDSLGEYDAELLQYLSGSPTELINDAAEFTAEQVVCEQAEVDMASTAAAWEKSSQRSRALLHAVADTPEYRERREGWRDQISEPVLKLLGSDQVAGENRQELYLAARDLCIRQEEQRFVAWFYGKNVLWLPTKHIEDEALRNVIKHFIVKLAEQNSADVRGVSESRPLVEIAYELVMTAYRIYHEMESPDGPSSTHERMKDLLRAYAVELEQQALRDYVEQRNRVILNLPRSFRKAVIAAIDARIAELDPNGWKSGILLSEGFAEWESDAWMRRALIKDALIEGKSSPETAELWKEIEGQYRKKLNKSPATLTNRETLTDEVESVALQKNDELLQKVTIIWIEANKYKTMGERDAAIKQVAKDLQSLTNAEWLEELRSTIRATLQSARDAKAIEQLLGIPWTRYQSQLDGWEPNIGHTFFDESATSSERELKIARIRFAREQLQITEPLVDFDILLDETLVQLSQPLSSKIDMALASAVKQVTAFEALRDKQAFNVTIDNARRLLVQVQREGNSIEEVNQSSLNVIGRAHSECRQLVIQDLQQSGAFFYKLHDVVDWRIANFVSEKLVGYGIFLADDIPAATEWLLMPGAESAHDQFREGEKGSSTNHIVARSQPSGQSGSTDPDPKRGKVKPPENEEPKNVNDKPLGENDGVFPRGSKDHSANHDNGTVDAGRSGLPRWVVTIFGVFLVIMASRHVRLDAVTGIILASSRDSWSLHHDSWLLDWFFWLPDWLQIGTLCRQVAPTRRGRIVRLRLLIQVVNRHGNGTDEKLREMLV